MKKNILKAICLSVFLLLCLVHVPLFAQEVEQAETITLVTYYPAPIGVYSELRSKKMAIGAAYYDPVEYCFDNACGATHEVSTGTDLTVEGNVGIGTTIPDFKLDVVGDIRADTFHYSSDITLKTNVRIIPNALEKINHINGVYFEWKKNGKESIGFIAQNIEKVLPEVVSANNNTGLKSVQYGNLTALTVEAIKEQQIQISNLKTEVETLKNIIAEK